MTYHALFSGHNYVVVFLKCHDNLTLCVDVDKFWLWILRRNLRQVRDVDYTDSSTIQTAVHHVNGHQETPWKLTSSTITKIFVALVLDRNGDEGTVGGT